MPVDPLSLAQDRIEKEELRHREIAARVKALQAAKETHGNSATFYAALTGSSVKTKATLPSSYSTSSKASQQPQEPLFNKLQIKQLTAEFNQHNGTHPTLSKLLQQQGISPTHTAQVWLLEQLARDAK